MLFVGFSLIQLPFNEDITVRYLDFFSTNVRPLQKSVKLRTKKLIDRTTCSANLLFSEYYFKLYTNVHKITVFFIFTMGDQNPVTQIKKIPKIFNFTDP